MLRQLLACALVCSLLPSVVSAASPKKKTFNPEAGARLLAAVSDGDIEATAAALAEGADPEVRDENGNTPLIIASASNLAGHEKELLETLIAAKAGLETGNGVGTTPLMAAAMNDQPEMARLLIAAGAKIEAKDADGWTPLMYAGYNGSWSVLQLLLDAKAKPNATDKKGWTPLLLALDQGHGNVADHLVKAGAKLTEKSLDGLSPLVRATYSHDLSAVRVALAAGAALNGRDQDGWTALEIAAYNDDVQILMDLLRAGADASLTDSEGKTALERAKQNERIEAVGLLGGPWTPAGVEAGTNLVMPCELLGGDVRMNFRKDGTALVMTTIYPRPLSWYIGGGLANRADTSRELIFDGSFQPRVDFDLEANPKSGAKAQRLTLDYSLYETSVTLRYLDQEGNEREKLVTANVLDPDLTQGDESIDVSEMGDDLLRAVNQDGVLVTRLPLAPLRAGGKGRPLKVTARAGSCPPGSVR